jgi:hypothetical protein
LAKATAKAMVAALAWTLRLGRQQVGLFLFVLAAP